MQPNLCSQKPRNILVKSVSFFYLERFQRYGVFTNVQLFGPPCIYTVSQKNKTLNSCTYLPQMLTDFQFFFTSRLIFTYSTTP